MTDKIIVPGKLARKIFVTDVFAVRTVGRGEAQRLDPGADQSGAEGFLAGKAFCLELLRQAAGNGDPVPAFLTVSDDGVAQLVELLMWKSIVNLQLLQAYRVGLAVLEPEAYEVEAGSQTVDVPGSSTHDLILAGGVGWNPIFVT